jgi:hypothetical protein
LVVPSGLLTTANLRLLKATPGGVAGVIVLDSLGDAVGRIEAPAPGNGYSPAGTFGSFFSCHQTHNID